MAESSKYFKNRAEAEAAINAMSVDGDILNAFFDETDDNGQVKTVLITAKFTSGISGGTVDKKESSSSGGLFLKRLDYAETGELVLVFMTGTSTKEYAIKSNDMDFINNVVTETVKVKDADGKETGEINLKVKLGSKHKDQDGNDVFHDVTSFELSKEDILNVPELAMLKLDADNVALKDQLLNAVKTEVTTDATTKAKTLSVTLQNKKTVTDDSGNESTTEKDIASFNITKENLLTEEEMKSLNGVVISKVGTGLELTSDGELKATESSNQQGGDDNNSNQFAKTNTDQLETNVIRFTAKEGVPLDSHNYLEFRLDGDADSFRLRAGKHYRDAGLTAFKVSYGSCLTGGGHGHIRNYTVRTDDKWGDDRPFMGNGFTGSDNINDGPYVAHLWIRERTDDFDNEKNWLLRIFATNPNYFMVESTFFLSTGNSNKITYTDGKDTDSEGLAARRRNLQELIDSDPTLFNAEEQGITLPDTINSFKFKAVMDYQEAKELHDADPDKWNNTFFYSTFVPQFFIAAELYGIKALFQGDGTMFRTEIIEREDHYSNDKLHFWVSNPFGGTTDEFGDMHPEEIFIGEYVIDDSLPEFSNIKLSMASAFRGHLSAANYEMLGLDYEDSPRLCHVFKLLNDKCRLGGSLVNNERDAFNDVDYWLRHTPIGHFMIELFIYNTRPDRNYNLADAVYILKQEFDGYATDFAPRGASIKFDDFGDENNRPGPRFWPCDGTVIAGDKAHPRMKGKTTENNPGYYVAVY